MKVDELEGALLDYWVARAKASGSEQASYYDQFHIAHGVCYQSHQQRSVWSPSTDWAQGGPIIEREFNFLTKHGPSRHSAVVGNCSGHGPTPLVAAMRAYVASKFGDEVDSPQTYQQEK